MQCWWIRLREIKRVASIIGEDGTKHCGIHTVYWHGGAEAETLSNLEADNQPLVVAAEDDGRNCLLLEAERNALECSAIACCWKPTAGRPE